MSEEEFAKLTLQAKWNHVRETMSYIQSMENMYDLRSRLNPHHPEKDKKYERLRMRTDQYQRWMHIKCLYAANRDEMANTLDSKEFNSCKEILEKIFTMELDNALRDIISDPETI
jgi:hypothetical protein